MRKAPIFRDAYEVIDEDLIGLVANINQDGDDIAADALVRTSKYTGMAVTQTSATAVLVANGRLWVSTGPRYYSDEAGGFPLDLSGQKPGLQNRVVLIVAYGEEIQTDLEERDYETDATTQTKEPRQTNVVTYRHVRLEAVPGGEAVSPVPPVVSSALTIASVLMSPAGITSITQNTAALLDNLGDVATRTSALEDWRETTDPKIATITSDLAALRARIDAFQTPQITYALAADVAELKLLAKLPQNYSNYRADDFFDATYSNAAAAGYAAKTEEGLRFPAAALNDSAMALNNAYDATVIVSGSGLMLPKYTEAVQRIVAGGVGYMALSQYAYESRTSTILTMSMSRVRYGQEFEESAGSSFFLSGQYLGGTSNQPSGAANTFLLNGQTYQVTDTGETDPDGHEILRLQMFWTDTTGSPYWSRVNSQQPITGYAWVETFVQQGDRWLTALSARVATKPATGTLYVGLCECTDGQPDLDKMLCLVGEDATFWTPGASLGGNKVPVPPTLLQGGQRYGYVLMTAADYYIGVVETGTSPTTGTLFYGLNGGIWQNDANRHIMFDAWYAAFPQATLAVELAGQNLPGGIASLDILNGQAVPASCGVNWQVFIGSAWQTLGKSDVSLFAGLPPYVRLQALLTGTQDVMPGLNLGASRVRVSRPATAVKHVSVIENLQTPSSTIVIKSTLLNFDPVHHTHAVKLLTGAGLATVNTPATVVDVVRGTTTERTSTFTLGAAVSSYLREIDETTDSATNLFVCTNVTDIAE